MMKRKNLYALFSCLFLSGCGMIDYHPYDVRISGETVLRQIWWYFFYCE